MKRIFALLFGLSLGLTLAAPALANTTRTCATRETIVKTLADKYGESRQSVGLGANNGLVEVFASPDTGTWTITITMPSGLTCLVASGGAFETLAEAAPVPGDDA